ncbi:MAG: hypothetical protein Q9222_001205 [Ikaeria aurantiellina]
MSSSTPHVAYLKDLTNFVPLGSFNLLVDSDKIYSAGWSERFPKIAHLGTFASLKTQEVQAAIWALLCLGWARTFIRTLPHNHGIIQVKVYILPADAGGRYMERKLRDWDYVKTLMQYLDPSVEAWNGLKSLTLPYEFTENQHDVSSNNDSLFYLFNTLPSPAPSSLNMTSSFSAHAITSLLNETEGIEGLRTNLYPYQRRSAATMIKREAEPVRALDPRLEMVERPDGGLSFYDRSTGVILRQPRYYEEAKGGILAETMGLGKTLICLAVILATKGHWPEIPPQHSLGQFPIRSKVGSLMQMAAAAASREQLPWRNYVQSMTSLGECPDNCRKALEENVPFYIIPALETTRSRRPTTVRPEKLVRLCPATLIVVPSNLFSHWRNELDMHVEADALNVLYLDSNEISTPKADSLLYYDVILMTKARLEEEMSLNSSLKIICACPVNECCRCSSKTLYESPLKDLHFLRIIVDEGHDFSSFGRKNNAVFALQKLHVDRRWIVSGTPSSGLLGVEASTATLETLSGVDRQESQSIREVLESRRSNGLDLDSDPRLRKSALLQEQKDLEKLGSIVVDFLNLKPWSNSKGDDDTASWRHYIIPTEDGRRKPKSLSNVLAALVVRHRVEDIEKDIDLPPLYNRTVYLEPRWHDKLSLNLFILTLAVNAVTSERIDEDYMFHPKNRVSLNQLITNLRYSGFHWTGFTRDEIWKSIEVSRNYLESKMASGECEAQSGNLQAGDFDFLQRAIAMGQTVLTSPSWTAFSAAHELGLYVDDFPEDARKAWSLTEDDPKTPLIVGTPHMARAQNHVDTHLYASDPADGLAALGTTTLERFWQSIQQKAEKTSEENNTNMSTQNSPLERKSSFISTSIQKPTTTNKRTISKAKLNASPRKVSSQRILPTAPEIPVRSAEAPAQVDRTPALKSALKSSLKSSSTLQPIPLIDPSSPLSRTRLVGTASAKLSYLLDRISVLHTTEKILIFYEGNHIAFYIAETLELLGIQFLIYTGTLSAVRKSAYITTFNTTETFRVLLMDVHQAAHGLHIASASRVFFVNPVWQPAVEAQAIKRAHRIGQTKPVYVETLVLKDTLEDRMLKRRKCMTAMEHHKAEKSLLDDDVMERLIRDAGFIELEEDERLDPRKQMAPLEKELKLFGRGMSSGRDPDEDLVFPEGLDPGAWKRRRGVRSERSGDEVRKKKKKTVGFGT